MTDDDLNSRVLSLEYSQSPPQPFLRSQLVAKFEHWLDQMLAEEPPTRGLPDNLIADATAMAAQTPPSQETDLFTLFSALTGLTGEIRLQGRAFKQLSDLLAPLSEAPAMLAKLREAQIESVVSIQAALIDQVNDPDTLPIPFKQICDVMVDLYDRLQRGLQTCDDGIRSLRSRRKGGWRRWLFRKPNSFEQAILSIQAIRDASGLTLARLQAAMQEWGIQRIGRVGEPFDSDKMSAVEVRVSNEVPPGSVLVVNRSGYALNGTQKATAQVTVAKTEI